jgi:hypothetical protein
LKVIGAGDWMLAAGFQILDVGYRKRLKGDRRRELDRIYRITGINVS